MILKFQSIKKIIKVKKKRNDIKNIKSINEKGTKQIMKNYNNKNSKKSMEFIDDEINELSYDLAIKYDKRNFCQYYISLVKTKHSLIFSFFNGNDYNSRIVKIDLFFIGFATEYIINALFYNDETMHKIYKNNGVFDLEAQLPIIIYSIYINTKIHLLKDTLMSFLLSLLFPFFTYLLPGLLRVHSLSDIKNKRECLYKLSKFLQSF